MQEKRLIRWLLSVLLAFLVLQTIVVLRFGEPWPSVALPKFANPGGETEVFTITKPALIVYFADSTAEKLSVNQFLDMVPESHHMTVMNENYRPVSVSGGEDVDRTTEAQGWAERLKDWIRNVLRSPTLVAPAQTSEGTAWTRQRLKALFPDREPLHCEVQWREITYKRSRGSLVERGDKVIQTLHIDL